MFSPAGATVWLSDEDQFDAVTAVSGSGPAYVYAFIEALAAAGAAAGLDPALAERLARATVTGAAALAAAEAATPAKTLRERVTSPNGTTAAGLAVLQPGLPPLGRSDGGGGGGAVAGIVTDRGLKPSPARRSGFCALFQIIARLGGFGGRAVGGDRAGEAAIGGGGDRGLVTGGNRGAA